MANSALSIAVSPVKLDALFRQLRPKQWVKNFIVFAPLLFSGNFSNPLLAQQASLCAISFCAISSAVYTLNDLIDLAADQMHPQKRLRPLASGLISPLQGLILAVSLLVLGLIGTFSLRPSLSIISLVYFLLNLAYIFSLKKFPIIDILCIACSFVLRAVAGAVAVHVVPSAWFLMCTTFGALFLALEKRRYEFVSLGEQAALHRQSLKKYSLELIERLESLIAPSLLATYSFYTFQSTSSHHGQWMMSTIPIVLYGMMRYQYLSEKCACTGSPEDVLWNDKLIQLTVVLWLTTCTAVIYGDPHSWVSAFANFVDGFRFQ
jgi:4-hydroxybenzoate polyprenyltransferase